MRSGVEGVSRITEYRLGDCTLGVWICVAALKSLAGDYDLRSVSKRAPEKNASGQKRGEEGN